MIISIKKKKKWKIITANPINSNNNGDFIVMFKSVKINNYKINNSFTLRSCEHRKHYLERKRYLVRWQLRFGVVRRIDWWEENTIAGNSGGPSKQKLSLSRQFQLSIELSLTKHAINAPPPPPLPLSPPLTIFSSLTLNDATFIFRDRI